jgi:PAS domain-containing protein
LGRNPEQAKFWEEYNDKVFTTGKTETLEFQYMSPSGKKYYFNTRAVPEFFNDKIISVLAISRDITDIKEAEAKLKDMLGNLDKLVEERTEELEKANNSLKEKEKTLAEAQKMAHIGIWEWNIKTGKLFWTDEVYHIFELDPQESKPTYNAFLNYVHPQDQMSVNHAIKEALNGKPYDIDYRIILPNGEERTIYVLGETIFDEKNTPIRMRGVVQDITERKKTEEKIKALADIIESSNDAILTFSLEGIITSWNKAAEHIYGYSAEEIVGKKYLILEPPNLKREIEQLSE